MYLINRRLIIKILSNRILEYFRLLHEDYCSNRKFWKISNSLDRDSQHGGRFLCQKFYDFHTTTEFEIFE